MCVEGLSVLGSAWSSSWGVGVSRQPLWLGALDCVCGIGVQDGVGSSVGEGRLSGVGG